MTISRRDAVLGTLAVVPALAGARLFGVGESHGEIARLDHRPPQFAFIGVAENSRQCGVRQLAVEVRFSQPAAEIAHARSRPKIEAGILMRSLDGIEQRSRKLGVRRENGMAFRDGRHQAGNGGFRAQSC